MTQDRDTWANKTQFLLACIGYCVGLGNIWRFPYLVYESGGGCFLIPYFIMLFLVGLPCLYMEFSLGLITQRGPVHAFEAICPMFKGIGSSTIVMSFIYASYFTTIIVYCLFYFVNSFYGELPWTYCANKTWSTELCTDSTTKYFNGSVPVTQEYFDNVVLHKTSGIEEFGNIRWALFGLLFFTWVAIYLFVFKGTKSIGKVVYFTAITPYVMLIALLIRGCTLSGAMIGIEYFLGLNGKGDWSKLSEIQVWVNASSQIFNSIGIGFGSLIAFSSFNKNNKTILRDTLFIGLVNSLTSLLSGFIIFSVLGHISEMVGVDIPDLAVAGPELVFVAYPQALVDMSPPWLWSILFFFTLFVLGIDSVFSSVEVVNTTIHDMLLKKEKPIRKEIIAGIVCAISFCFAVPNTFDGGIYLYKLLDWYTAVQSLAILACIEVVVICWIYNPNRLCNEVEKLTGHAPPLVFKIMWYSVTPIIVIIIMFFSILGYEKLTYGDYEYPAWCDALGWVIASLSLICVPVGAAHEIFWVQSHDSYIERMRIALSPRKDLDSQSVNYLSPIKVQMSDF